MDLQVLLVKAVGTHNVELTVTDSSGRTASDSMSITVEEAPAPEEEDNNTASDDLIDVDDFMDDLFDRLGLR